MKPGDLVKFKCSPSYRELVVQYGTFIGIRKFTSKYECAEVMWHNKTAPNGDLVSIVQKDLIEVVK